MCWLKTLHAPICSARRYKRKGVVAIFPTEGCSVTGYSALMRMQEASDYVQKALLHSGLSQSELARLISPMLHREYDRSIINKIVKQRRETTAAELEAIASVTKYPLPPSLRQGVVEVPEVSWVSAGRMSEVFPVTDEYVTRRVPMVGLADGDWIALRVEGDSMNLVAPEDSLIFVNRREKDLLDGAFYVFAEPDGSATFKQYGAEPPRMEPVSSNRRHRVKIARGEIQVVGRVRCVMATL